LTLPAKDFFCLDKLQRTNNFLQHAINTIVITSVGQAFDFVNTEGSGFSNISESDNHQFQLFGEKKNQNFKNHQFQLFQKSSVTHKFRNELAKDWW